MIEINGCACVSCAQHMQFGRYYLYYCQELIRLPLKVSNLSLKMRFDIYNKVHLSRYRKTLYETSSQLSADFVTLKKVWSLFQYVAETYRPVLRLFLFTHSFYKLGIATHPQVTKNENVTTYQLTD